MSTASETQLRQALERLTDAAERRETIMGDVPSLLDAKANLAAAAKAARALLTSCK